MGVTLSLNWCSVGSRVHVEGRTRAFHVLSPVRANQLEVQVGKDAEMCRLTKDRSTNSSQVTPPHRSSRRLSNNAMFWPTPGCIVGASFFFIAGGCVSARVTCLARSLVYTGTSSTLSESSRRRRTEDAWSCH